MISRPRKRPFDPGFRGRRPSGRRPGGRRPGGRRPGGRRPGRRPFGAGGAGHQTKKPRGAPDPHETKKVTWNARF